MRARIGLDQPILSQYLTWLGGILSGDLGVSLWTRRPVAAEIAGHVWPTLELTLLALVIGAGAFSLPLGVLMAHLRGQAAGMSGSRSARSPALTIPSFWLGIMMILALTTLAPDLAGSRLCAVLARTRSAMSASSMLPAFALALPILANLARLVRSAMLDALQQDFRPHGASQGRLGGSRILFRHALRNALIPFVTSAGIMTGYLLGGAIVVEQVFAIPGLGRLILGAIAERNYPLVQATILVDHLRLRAGQFPGRSALRTDRPARAPVSTGAIEGRRPSRTPKLLVIRRKRGRRSLVAARACSRRWISPYDPLEQSVLARLKGPSAEHWLGTDQFGRDLLSRIIHGLRASLVDLGGGGRRSRSFSAARSGSRRPITTAGPSASPCGCMDVFFAFPVILLAIGVIAMLGPGSGPDGDRHRRRLYADLRAAAACAGARRRRERLRRACPLGRGVGHPYHLMRYMLPNLASVRAGPDQSAALGRDPGRGVACPSSGSVPNRPRPRSARCCRRDATCCCFRPGVRCSPASPFCCWPSRSTCSATRCAIRLDPRLRGEAVICRNATRRTTLRG